MIPNVTWFQEGPGVRNTQYTESGVKLLNVANLVDGEIDLSTSKRYISEEEAYGKYKHFLVDYGDFIIASSGIQVEYFEKKMGFITSEEQLPLCMNTSTIRFKPLDKRVLNMRFFMYYLKSNDFKSQLLRQITGIAQLNFGPLHLKRMYVPVPSLEEQERIVAEIDLLTGIIDKQKAQLKELDTLAQSIFYDMFGNPVENEKGWKTGKLQSVAPQKSYIGKVPQIDDKYWLLNLDMIEQQTGRVIKKVLFSDNEIGSSTILFDTTNVLFSKLRPYLNKVVIPDDIGYGTSELVPLKPNPDFLSRCFFAHLLRSSVFVDFISVKVAGAKMPRVSMDELRNFSVILPPLSLQELFAEKISNIEHQKESINRSIAETQKLFDYTMDKYFG